MRHMNRARFPVLAGLLYIACAGCDSGSDEPKPPVEQMSLDAAVTDGQPDAAMAVDSGSLQADTSVVRPPPPAGGDLGQNSQDDTFLRADSVVLAAPNLVTKPLGIEVRATTQAQQTINEGLVLDNDGDGFLDLSLLVRFIGAADPKAAAGKTTVGGGLCPYPAAPETACKPDPYFPFQSPFLSYEPGTSCQLEGTNEVAGEPCFVTQQAPITLTLPLLGRVPLEHGQVIGRWEGKSIVEGRVRGFLSMETAGSVRLPDPVPPAFAALGIKPGTPLLDFLSTNEVQEGPGAVRGWWFLLKFTAQPSLFAGATQ